MGYSSWDCKEMDTTKQLKLSLSFNIIFNVFSNFNTFPYLAYETCISYSDILLDKLVY